MQVCESAPMTRSPGLAKLSATRWWHTPISTSLSVAPEDAQKALIVFCALASSLRGAGAAWSMKNTQVGALTVVTPSLLDLLDREGPGAVLGDSDVDVADDDLPRHDHVQPGVCGEELLGQRERRQGAAPPASAAATASSFAFLPIGTASPRRAR